VFVETLNWLSMAIRSGVWTYYEATPQARQDALAAALRQAASAELASRYEQGMRDWRDETRIAAVDRWMKTNEDATDEWLRALLRRSREGLLELAAE
jgi:ABC-type proline/glycine betaine transport system substrate-binding protein